MSLTIIKPLTARLISAALMGVFMFAPGHDNSSLESLAGEETLARKVPAAKVQFIDIAQEAGLTARHITFPFLRSKLSEGTVFVSKKQ